MADYPEPNVSAPARKKSRRTVALVFLGVVVAGIAFCLTVLIILVKTGVFTMVSKEVIMKGKIANARVEENMLTQAIKIYLSDVDFSLSGDAPHIIAALRGDNRRKVVFLDVPARRLAATGAYLDPWGTPYQIAVPDASSASVRIRSAGPDKVFEESKSSDDIVSEQ